VAIALLTLWILLCHCSDPATHPGSFFGNAIADWSGPVIIIPGTKYLLEAQSSQSRRGSGPLDNPVLDFLWRRYC